MLPMPFILIYSVYRITSALNKIHECTNHKPQFVISTTPTCRAM